MVALIVAPARQQYGAWTYGELLAQAEAGSSAPRRLPSGGARGRDRGCAFSQAGVL